MNGLASKCNFGTITESLVKDVFIVNLINKEVQQKLCTEPKTTERQYKVCDSIRRGNYQTTIIRQHGKTQNKNRIAGNKQHKPKCKKMGTAKKCFRCEGIFTPQHLKECKAIGITCMKCGKKGHFAKCCQTKGPGNFAKSRKVAKPPQRIQ